VDVGGGVPATSKGGNHPVVKEVTVTILWEETKLQPEELEDKCFLEYCEDNFDIIQPVPKEKKPYQSSFSFDCEDMASLYGSGGERGVRRFSGATGTIEVDDFKREFTMWCEF
jgi:hypothetical protein